MILLLSLFPFDASVHVIGILCCQVILDMTNYLVLSIIANPVAPEDEAFLKAPLVDECGWDLGDLVAMHDDGEPELRVM